jgi:hypothetical protein
MKTSQIHLLLLRRRLRRADRARRRRITGVRGDPDAPGQLRPPVHQGRDPAPETAPDPPAVSRAARARGEPRAAHELGCGARCAPSASPRSSRARPGFGRLLHLRPVADRGLLRLQQAGQGPDRHQQRRYQLAPVHVEAVAGYKQTLGADAPPCSYEDIDQADTILIAGANPASPTRSSSAASRMRGRQSGPEDHRRRPAPHRHRRDCRPAPGDQARHRHRAVQRHAARAARAKAWSMRPSSPPTPTASTPCASIVKPMTPAVAAEICGIDAADIVTAARWFGGRRRRCRCGARGSTSRRTAPTTTPR